MNKLLLSVDGELAIKGVANSLLKSRSGDQVNADSAKNVIGQTVPLLIGHDWGMLPVGMVTMDKVGGDGLEFTGKLFKTINDLEQIIDGIKNSVLSVSVGLVDGHYNDNGEYADFDLLELSLTPTPADSYASVTFQSMDKIKNGGIKMALDPKEEPKDDPEPEPKVDPKTDPKDDPEPTLADVLKAIADLAKTVGEIKDNDTEPEPKDAPEPSADEVKQAYKQELMRMINRGAGFKEIYLELKR